MIPHYPSQALPDPCDIVDHWLTLHGDELLAFAARRTLCVATAEDLVQETFLAAIELADGVISIDSPRAWLFTTLRRRLIDHYRREHHRCGDRHRSNSNAPQEHVLADSASRFDDAAAALECDELQTAMLQCVDGLPKRMAGAFRLRVISGLSVDEAAEILGVPASTLAAHLYRARLSVRECLSNRNLL